jgi:5-methylcytosine-specific restriction endonuclease McrA
MPKKSGLSAAKQVMSWTRKMNAASRRMAATNRRLANQRLAREKKEARERAAREKIRYSSQKWQSGNYGLTSPTCTNCGASPSRDARFCPMCGGKIEARSAPNRTIPSNVKMYVWQRDGGRCVECGSNEKLEYDHIIPVSKGGSNTERNVQLLCEHCNRKKQAKIM